MPRQGEFNLLFPTDAEYNNAFLSRKHTVSGLLQTKKAQPDVSCNIGI